MLITPKIKQECPQCRVEHYVGRRIRDFRTKNSIEFFIILRLLHKCPNCKYIYFNKKVLNDEDVKKISIYLNSKEYSEDNPWLLASYIYQYLEKSSSEMAEVLLPLYLHRQAAR